MSEENSVIDNFVFSDSEMSSVEPFAFDYDYRQYLQTIIKNQDSILDYEESSFNCLNAGFTMVILFIGCIFSYFMFKDFIGD